MARVLKNYKSYKGFKLSGAIGVPACILLMALAIIFFDKLPVQATFMLIVSMVGFIPFLVFLIIGMIYGGINAELAKSLSLLDDKHVILYDLKLREYNNKKISAFVASPQGAYCIDLVATTPGVISGEEQSPKWKTYNRAVRRGRTTFFNNPVTEVQSQINMIKQKMLSSGIDINIVPVIVFKNNTDLNEIKTSYPVIHTADVVQFINQNKLPINISPEQVAATLER